MTLNLSRVHDAQSFKVSSISILRPHTLVAQGRMSLAPGTQSRAGARQAAQALILLDIYSALILQTSIYLVARILPYTRIFVCMCPATGARKTGVRDKPLKPIAGTKVLAVLVQKYNY